MHRHISGMKGFDGVDLTRALCVAKHVWEGLRALTCHVGGAHVRPCGKEETGKEKVRRVNGGATSSPLKSKSTRWTMSVFVDGR